MNMTHHLRNPKKAEPSIASLMESQQLFTASVSGAWIITSYGYRLVRTVPSRAGYYKLPDAFAMVFSPRIFLAV